MQRIGLTAETRCANGKGGARKLRMAGQLPAVLYGEQKDPQPLAVNRHEFALKLQRQEGLHLLVELVVSGAQQEETLAMIKDIDIDPISRKIVHVDFVRVNPDKPIRTTLPIVTTGLPIGVRNGGVLQQVLRELDVEALPKLIPEHVEIDVSNLEIGDSLHVSDLDSESLSFAILSESERAIATVLAPKLSTASSDEEEESAGEEEEAEEND